MTPLTFQSKAGAIPVTDEQARTFLSEAATATWKEGPGYQIQDTLTIHGERSLDKAQESGYQLEGKVTLGGDRWRAFTSSQLFELPSGKLVDVAILHVCVGQK